MPFYTGTGSSLQIGKEKTYGTGVTPDTLVDITSEGIKVSVEKGDQGSLLASKTPMSRDLLGITVDGSVSFILRPEFAGLLFHLALGGADKVTAVGESGNQKHTLHLCGANEDLPGMTVVIDRKASVKKYPGCTIAALSMDCAAGDYVKGSIDIKGTKEEPGTLTPQLTGFEVPSYRCTSAKFTFGGKTYDIASSSIKLDNALEEAPKTYSTGLYKGRPQHGRRSVTVSFEIPYSKEIDTLKDSYLLTEANAAVTLTFTSSNQDYSIIISMPNVAINTVDANVGGTGILNSSVSGEALSVGNTEPLEVVITDKTAKAYGV